MRTDTGVPSLRLAPTAGIRTRVAVTVGTGRLSQLNPTRRVSIQPEAARKKKKEAERPDLSDRPDLWNFTAADEDENVRPNPDLDPFETILPELSLEERGLSKYPDELWDPGIVKASDESVQYDYLVQTECDNFDLEYVRGRVRGNKTHPFLWWEQSGCIAVINMMADGEDVRPWNIRYNPDTGYDKKRGWLCIEDQSPVLGNKVSRLIGFESFKDARRVKEIISRNIYDRLRQPVIEYVSPEEFKAAASDNVEIQGAVTVIQAPLYAVYGSKGWEEIEAKILEHPKDMVTRQRVEREPDNIIDLNDWDDVMGSFDQEIKAYKEYLEWLDRFQNGKLKGVREILEDSREVGGM
eukprot:CAMPEP_0184483740 /NCGR_PEP_ID=MMETSP0113_2-20130426/5417_1 /TAXON_ID=91329 /ORGANISM="Norrisiella sphaerica, Strain BC52" /LENGTH=352 /DNA_ID=CAMNT_0026864325 /DNA_START=181 /DNA_END=1239 /DNA_ORIENTATION=+